MNKEIEEYLYNEMLLTNKNEYSSRREASSKKLEGFMIRSGTSQGCTLCRPFSTSYWSSLVARMVKNLPAMQDTWVLSLGWEDPLEKGLANHSSILA